MENTDWLVFWVVAAARILIPLTIPLFPLPGIIASLVLDAIDQTIFQQFPGMHLENYQGYDKALDIYYLTIAYISTMRNWTSSFAFQVSRFLFYWRLAGVVLFELTQIRWLLLIFPNTFEYFFIFYEIFRLRWDPKRMSKKFWVIAAGCIWIVVKLPQEYWVHILQTDTTDWVKTILFKVPVNTSWGEILITQPEVCLIGIIVTGLVLTAFRWFLKQRLPPADRALAFTAYAHQPAFTVEQVQGDVINQVKLLVNTALLEKIILVTLVSIIFAQVLPGVRATDLQLAVGVVIIVILNTVLSQFFAQRGFGVKYAIQQFIVLASANSFVMLTYTILRTVYEFPVRFTNAVFFVLLFSLLITLFDQYRQVYLMRFSSIGGSIQNQPALVATGTDENDL